MALAKRPIKPEHEDLPTLEELRLRWDRLYVEGLMLSERLTEAVRTGYNLKHTLEAEDD